MSKGPSRITMSIYSVEYAGIFITYTRRIPESHSTVRHPVACMQSLCILKYLHSNRSILVGRQKIHKYIKICNVRRNPNCRKIKMSEEPKGLARPRPLRPCHIQIHIPQPDGQLHRPVDSSLGRHWLSNFLPLFIFPHRTSS